MYSGDGRLSLAKCQHYCTDPDVTWETSRGCPHVVHYLADLQYVHRFHCYSNIAQNVKCQQVPVLALCMVYLADNRLVVDERTQPALSVSHGKIWMPSAKSRTQISKTELQEVKTITFRKLKQEAYWA